MVYNIKNLLIYTFLTFCLSCLFLACSKTKTVLPPLSFISVNVNNGGYNSIVVISGTGFSSNKADDDVRFNGKPAQITAVSSTNITVKVPLGAGTGNITIAVNGVTANGPVFTYVLSSRVSNYAGNGTTGNLNGPGSAASFNDPNGLAIDAAGNLYVSDASNYLIRKISTDSTVSTFVGGGNVNSDTNGTGTQASITSAPTAIALDGKGNIYVTEFDGVIRKITPAAVVSTFLDGRFVPGYSFDYPSGIAIDASGNLYVSVYFHNQIQKVTPSGVVTNFVGSGNTGSSDAVPVSFFNPAGLTFDATGILYIADYSNSKIRFVDVNGKVGTIAGFSPPNTTNSGSVNGPISLASFRGPSDIAVDAKGNIYIADTQNNLIRMISADRSTVSTIAGNGNAGSTNGAGNVASFNYPSSLVVDATGNIYVADSKNNAIRKIVIF